MGIYLPNMEMPNRCLDCPLMVSRENDECIVQSEVANEIAITWEDLKANCPLVEVPTPHGRLIDADALSDKLGISDRDIYCKCVIEEDAPTVIEAEGSET